MRTTQEQAYIGQLAMHLEASSLNRLQQMQNFPLYVPRQDLTKFLCRHEIFKRVLNIQGSIVECGVFLGGGLLTWAQLSAIYEPTNHQRRIIGVDTWAGIPGLAPEDGNGQKPDFAVDGYAEIRECIRLYDLNRFVGHVPKVELVRGDARKTIRKYVEENKHLVVSLLYLDFDLYQPTIEALMHFAPCMGKGSIIAFDEVNNANWPGETLAAKAARCFGGNYDLRWERFSFGSTICFAEIG